MFRKASLSFLLAHSLFLLGMSRFAMAETPEEPLPEPVALRIANPEDRLYANGPNFVSIQARYQGSQRWVMARPDSYRVEVTGPASLVQDISNQPRNPFVLIPSAETLGGEEGRLEDLVISVRVIAEQASEQRQFRLDPPESAKSVTLRVAPEQKTHTYTGLGAGVMFYDNQFNISDELFDWCFKDVDTQIVHALIRPDFEPANDNDDWQNLNEAAFDWSACERFVLDFMACQTTQSETQSLRLPLLSPAVDEGQ